MQFIKLNNNWDAEPNAPMPKIAVNNTSSMTTLSFYLNWQIHADVREDDKGVLEFNNCFLYRLEPTNDEGFYRGKCRFSKTGIKWGDFYQVIDSNWRNDFPNDKKVVADNLENYIDLKHYLFYFRDETFECIADSYKFRIDK